MTLRDLLAAGTARPWQHEQTLTGRGEIHCDIIRCGEQRVILAHDGEGGDADFREADAALICAAVNGAEALLQAAEERDALVDAIRDAADDVLGMQELAPTVELLGRIGSYAHEQRTRLVNAALRLDVAGVPDDSARTHDRESARVDVLAAQRDTALRDLEAVRVERDGLRAHAERLQARVNDLSAKGGI